MATNTGPARLPFQCANFISHLPGVLFISFTISNKVLPMATETTKKNWGGARRGCGRKKKSRTLELSKTHSVVFLSSVFQSWNALKERLKVPTNNCVAEYLLNMYDSFDLQQEG